MKRALICFGLFCLLLFSSVWAESLIQDDDLTGTICIPYDASDPSSEAYVYTYRYPHIADSEPDADCVNLFFDDLLDALETNLLFTAEGYADAGIPVEVTVDYKVTCNNSEFFSMMLIRKVVSGTDSRTIWQGHTFSRRTSGSGTCDLAAILGLSDPGGLDEERRTRQNEKVNQAVRRLVLKQMEINPQNIEWLADFSPDDLDYMFYPVEDFYLDKNGNPVFYLEPGVAADESVGYVRFSIPLSEIADEL